jgi:protein-arginine kinase activator protein McsA
LRDSDALASSAVHNIVSPLDSLMQDKDLPLDLSLGEFPSDEDEVDAIDEMELEDFSGSDEFDGAAFIANMEGLENDPFANESDPFADAASDEKPALLSGSDAIFGLDSGDAGDRDFSSARCPKCGTTWDRLRQDGRAGCAQCYATFASQLADVMGRVQKASQHAGKAPRALEKRQRRLVHLRARRDSRLELLKRRLKESVAREKYEEAAQLRDKIKLLASTIVED